MRAPHDRSATTASILAAGLAAFLVPGLAAQGLASWEPPVARDNPFPLTIESIMRGPELVGEAPVGVTWADDGSTVYFRWLPGGEPWYSDRRLYRVSAAGGTPEVVDEAEEEALAPVLAGGDVSPDGAWRAVSAGGDLYLIRRSTEQVRRLTETEAFEGGPEFSGDGRSIYFRRDNDLFAFSIDDGSIHQLTRIAAGPAPRDEPEAEGQKAFLEEQQRELFEHIRIENLREERRDAERERREEAEPKTLYLGNDQRAGGLEADPTGRYVAVTANETGAQGERTDIPRWITDTGYTEDTQGRAKVGDEQPDSRIAIVEVATGNATWLDFTEGEDGETPFTNFLAWSDSGSYGLVNTLDKDFKTTRLWAIDPATGEKTLLDELHDEAWVGGPCSSRFGGGCVGWLPGNGDNPRAWFVNETTGFAHVFTVRADGTDRRQLTQGDWEVLSATIPPGWDRFLLHTNEGSPANQHPWTMAFDGSDRTPLIEGPGFYRAEPSPDGSRLAVVASHVTRPPELYLMDAKPGSRLEQVTVSPTEEWRAFDWIEPEIIHFTARDGVQVPAHIYRPSDFGVERNGAAVVFVHGAGYLQNVHNGWSSYYHEYMFHHFLAAQGYTVLDIDYRGSAGYGRDWRTAIYRHMGGWDLSDQVDGAAYLVDQEGVDAGRIGIYGGSYGGFMTLMAMFTEPGVFAAGAGLRSVTDWAHYNHGYTAQILNRPQDDPEAYRQSSPIYFAEGLEGHLLMAHGMYDTNVHFSDIVRLTQRLIELGKENWELAVYPVENHGFVEPVSWTDEYRRIFALFDRVIGGGARTAAQGDGG